MSKPSNVPVNAADMAKKIHEEIFFKGFMSCLGVVNMIEQNKFNEIQWNDTNENIVGFFSMLNKRLNKETNMTTRTTKKVAPKTAKTAVAKVAKKATKKVTKKVTTKKPAYKAATKKAASSRSAVARKA